MKSQSRGNLVALLTPDLATAVQLEWAVFLAAASGLDLLVMQRMEDPEDRVEEIGLDEPAEGEAQVLVRELKQIVGSAAAAGDGTPPIHARLLRIHFSSLPALRRQVLAEVRACNARILTVAYRRLDDGVAPDRAKEQRRFLRYIPCELVVCEGLEHWSEPKRILVPVTADVYGKTALKVGNVLAIQAGASLTALQVNPPVDAVAEQVGERKLERILARTLKGERANLHRRVIVDDQQIRGVRRVQDEDEHDMIVAGVGRISMGKGIGARYGKGVPTVTVTAGSPFAGHLLEKFEDTISRIVPQIEREDRVALVDKFQSSAAWNFDFLILMVLSTVIAAAGLIQNSGAVVIGAMLVAPLMTPLLGLGLSIEQGNAALARLTLGSLMRGVGVSLLGGFLVGFGTAGFEEPTREMLARGGPGLLDLFVAFVAGIAAAYASTRSSLIAALPGVAIAAALVPPIATSGLALALGEFRLAIGALLLFGINMVTIVLATMVTLWAVGIRNPGTRARWLQGVGVAIIVSVLGLGLYLSLQMGEAELTEDIPSGLTEAIRAELGESYRLDELAVAYDELGVQLHVTVVGREPAPEDLATQVRNVAGDHYDHPVRVRLLTRIAIEVEAGARQERVKE